jgi:hypothetical protein
LPLAALLRLSLVFPDQAPSRFAIALRSNNTRKLEQRIAYLNAGDFHGDEAEAARIIVELAASLSKHDRLTRGHSERVRAYTALIAEEMGLSNDDSNRLQWAGLIHDVGKLRIPYEILTKPGKLTDREFEIIKTHPAEGMRIAAPLAGFLGEWINAVGQHHERFDGGGYPNGLVGDQISLGGRIVAVADTYDVITAARTYRKPESAAWAREEIARCAGTQFDPAVVRAFLNIGLGEVGRTMWPLSWALQIPFLGSAVTAPIAQTLAASVVALATATGIAAAGGGLAPILNTPQAIAFVETLPTLSNESTASTVAAGRGLPPGSSSTFDIQQRSQVGDSGASRTPIASTTSTIVDTTTFTSTIGVDTAASMSTIVVDTTTTTVLATTTTTEVAAVDPTTTTSAPTTTAVVIAPLDDCERAQEAIPP